MTMPAGEYYIGDLCYVLHEHWDEFCNLTIRGHNLLNGEFFLSNGHKVTTYTTAWGDGLYEDNHGLWYSVDAGLIGCIKKEYIDLSVNENTTKLGHFHTFTSDFETYSKDGKIHFGDVVIDTDPKDDIDEEGYYNDE